MPANTEKILSSVYAIRAMLETDKPAAVAAALDTLTADLTDQMRRDAAAQAGRGNAEKIIRGVLRNADALRKGDDSNPIKWQWTDAQGRQCVCDGFVAFRLVDALPLPPRPANAPKAVDLDKLFCKDVTHAAAESGGHPRLHPRRTRPNRRREKRGQGNQNGWNLFRVGLWQGASDGQRSISAGRDDGFSRCEADLFPPRQ